MYGYDRPTSPHLDALARESAVIRDHIAQAPYTKSSVASLFTGRFGSSHKALTISVSFAAAMAGRVEKELPVTDVLDPGLWTLAGALSSVGLFHDRAHDQSIPVEGIRVRQRLCAVSVRRGQARVHPARATCFAKGSQRSSVRISGRCFSGCT